MKSARTVAVGLGAAALVAMGCTSASAGEVTGNGEATQGPAHANSICVFSGLEDGSEVEGQPAGPGAPPQNWGHVQQFLRDMGVTVEELKASGAQPGDSCNGHSGILAGGGEEPEG